MKKLVYLAAVAFAASMVSCGNSENKAAEADSTAVVEEAVEVVEVADSAAADTVAADTVAADSVNA